MNITESLQQRKGAAETVRRALNKLEYNRLYAMTPDAEAVLTALARAVWEQRYAEGRHPTDEPSATDEMVEVIKKLAAVGCNILQSRPNDKKPLPQLWTNPITGQPLSPPKGPDERSLL